jgi:outer membrane protein TolC
MPVPAVPCAEVSVGKERVPEGILAVEKNSSADLIGKVELDLTLLADVAFENSPETRRMWFLAQAAMAQKKRLGAAFYPSVSVDSSLGRQRLDNPLQSDSSADRVTVEIVPSLRLHYTLYTFGADRAIAAAAGHALSAANFQYNRSLQTLLFQVQSKYFALNSTLAARDARESNLHDATEVCRMAKARLEAGLGDRQTFLQAKASRLRARCQLEEAKAAIEVARAALAEVVGVRVSRDFRVLRSQLPEKIELLDWDVEQSVVTALALRQDLLAFHAQFQAMEQMERAVMRGFYPKIGIAFEGGRSHFHGRGSGETFSLSASVSWDLFSGFDRCHRLLEQRAQGKVAFENMRAAGLRAAGEVWSQYFTYRSSFQRLRAARALIVASEEAFSAMEAAYRSGLSSFIDLLNAQNVLAASREGLVAAENSFSTSLVALAHATGSMEQVCP